MSVLFASFFFGKMVYCAVVGCSNGSKSGKSFYSFPSKEKERARHYQWLSRVRCKRRNWKPTKFSKICSDHFAGNSFLVDPATFASVGFNPGQMRLKKDAVPTIFQMNQRPVKEPYGQVVCRDRLVVRTLRCGRNNSGSNPGHGTNFILLSLFLI